MSRGRTTKPYSNARHTTFRLPLPVQQASWHCGGCAVAGPLRFGLAQQHTSSPPSSPVAKATIGPEDGKHRPQQGVGDGDAVDAGLRRGEQKRGGGGAAGPVAAERGRHRNHPARTQRQRHAEQGRLQHRPEPAAAQVPLDELRRDAHREHARHQKAEQQVGRHLAQHRPAFSRSDTIASSSRMSTIIRFASSLTASTFTTLRGVFGQVGRHALGGRLHRLLALVPVGRADVAVLLVELQGVEHAQRLVHAAADAAGR